MVVGFGYCGGGNRDRSNVIEVVVGCGIGIDWREKIELVCIKNYVEKFFY